MLTAPTTVCKATTNGSKSADVAHNQPPTTITDDRINRTTPVSKTATVAGETADAAAVAADSNNKRHTVATVTVGGGGGAATTRTPTCYTAANITPIVTVVYTNCTISDDMTANTNNGLVQNVTPMAAGDAESIVATPNGRVVSFAPHPVHVCPAPAPTTATSTRTSPTEQPATVESSVVSESGPL